MIEEVATIVAAFLTKGQLAPTEIPALITQVNTALSRLGQAPAVAAPEKVPAIPIRRSLQPNKLTCIDCGYAGKILKRHLSAKHGMTPSEYRPRWGLPSDYPMAAPAYASRRSELARSIGLSKATRGGRAKK